MKFRAEEYYQAHGTFPLTATASTPVAACCLYAGMQCPAVLVDWNRAPWIDLSFVMTVPFPYQYSYFATGGGSGAIATAVGDLDCDGESSQYTLTCTSSGANANCELTVPPIID